jgi:hypothetical protein
MADQGKYPGRLIAVDGSRGKDVAVAAGDLLSSLKRDGIECAVSRWDASGLFTVLAAGARIEAATGASVLARAANLGSGDDIAHWHQATVEQFTTRSVDFRRLQFHLFGHYEECCVLMRFAPAADLPRPRAGAQDRPAVETADRSRLRECGAVMLEATAPARVKAARRKMMEQLDRARRRKVFHLSNKGIGLLKKELLTAGRTRRAGLLRDLATDERNPRLRKRRRYSRSAM